MCKGGGCFISTVVVVATAAAAAVDGDGPAEVPTISLAMGFTLIFGLRHKCGIITADGEDCAGVVAAAAAAAADASASSCIIVDVAGEVEPSELVDMTTTRRLGGCGPLRCGWMGTPLAMMMCEGAAADAAAAAELVQLEVV